MALFHSFVVRDVVEVEPVYFPDHAIAEDVTGIPSASPSSAAGAEGADDLIRQPYQRTFDDILVHRLTERYVGKIVPGHGLCVAVHDVLQYTQSVVRGPSASAWLTAQFRLCIFAPAVGARLRATIIAQNRRGLFLSLDFFQFVFFVPGDGLIEGSFFVEKDKHWVLPLEGTEEEEGDVPSFNSYENGHEVVVKVERVTVRELVDYHGSRGAKDAGDIARTNAVIPIYSDESTTALPPPMEVIGSFVGDGLGPVAWFEE